MKVLVIAFLVFTSTAAMADGICGRNQRIVETIQMKIHKHCSQITNDDLAQIKELSLKYAKLNSLETSDFEGLVNVYELDLSNNSLTSIPTGFFQIMPNLEELTLSGNSFTTLQDGVFAGSPNLYWVDLGFCKIETLSSHTFDGAAIAGLSLAQNSLTSLPEGVFDNVSLMFLSLRNNFLTELPTNLFPNGNFDELYLNQNFLTSLPADLLATSPDIETFSASQNRITEISADFFANQNDWLYEIYLYSNQLSQIPDGLTKNGDIDFLMVQFNNLSNIQPTTFNEENFPRGDLYIEGNPLTEADKNLLTTQLGNRVILGTKTMMGDELKSKDMERAKRKVRLKHSRSFLSLK